MIWMTTSTGLQVAVKGIVADDPKIRGEFLALLRDRVIGTVLSDWDIWSGSTARRGDAKTRAKLRERSGRQRAL